MQGIAHWKTNNAIFTVCEDGQLHSCRLKATADSPERAAQRISALGYVTLENGQALYGRRASVDDASA